MASSAILTSQVAPTTTTAAALVAPCNPRSSHCCKSFVKLSSSSSSLLLRGADLQKSAFVSVTKRRDGAMAVRPRVQQQAIMILSQDELKKIIVEKAMEYVKSGMVLGLGTGSIATFVVAKIGELLKEGKLKAIVGVPTSKVKFNPIDNCREQQATALGIPLLVLDDHPKIDLAIDGADEVDPDLNLVKGQGGALLREKMVETASAKFVVIVDETKLVKGLGGSQLAMPVEGHARRGCSILLEI